MTEEAKRDWLLVAWGSLRHLPEDALRIGCTAARQKCDHPSKIVPAIIAETKDIMRWRKSVAREDFTPRLEAPDENYCSPEEATRILTEFGLKRSWS